VESSASRIEGFTNTLVTKYGVKLYDSIEELSRNVDAILIESVDGRPHLDQARRAFAAHKPVFIDKPLAGTLRDGIELVRLAREQKVPLYSASSLRYAPFVLAVKRMDMGKQLGAFSVGPAHIEPHHPDMFYYGVHAVEMLYTALGRGCVSVVRTHTEDTDVLTGVWSDGRVGTMRGERNAKTEYALIIFGAKGMAQDKQGTGGYGPLVAEIVKFFRTGVSPVAPEETLETLAFMEAADESKRRGGASVTLAEVMKANGAAVEAKP
jgi:predicted dehydrogenase